VWAADLFDYAGVYGVDLSTTKEERVRFGESAMTHAMLFTGVDLDEDGTARRWRVENSWGTENGDKGFYTMDDSWFDEYMFEVVVRKDRLPAELQSALQTQPLVLPAWDPMGALA
jgi:bleomycin hydrolase